MYGEMKLPEELARTLSSINTSPSHPRFTYQYCAAVFAHPITTSPASAPGYPLALPITRPRPLFGTYPLTLSANWSHMGNASHVDGVAPVLNTKAYGPCSPLRKASV